MCVSCNNASVINISKNSVQHSHTKHIDKGHYFIKDLVENGTMMKDHVTTENQLAETFTKDIDAQRLVSLRKSLGVCIMMCMKCRLL